MAEGKTGSGSNFGFLHNGAGNDAIEDNDDGGGENKADDGEVEYEPGHVAHVHSTRVCVHVCCQYWQRQQTAHHPSCQTLQSR